ncbi:MAG TPA: hypothetical protein VEK76_07690, partial [Candidatus Binatia bacterium]|nr:hypothetical protein [Candidatus Binatia bacterium]
VGAGVGTDLAREAPPAADLTAAAEVAALEVPPEITAQSLGQYLRGWSLRVRGGDTGVLPVVLGLAVIAAAFAIVTPGHAFLSPSNLVNIFIQSTVFITLAMAEGFALLIGEIDLSIGFVAGLGGVIAADLVQPGVGHAGWPWWAAILAALLVCALIGAIQGSLISRLKLPSFIVTLSGYLIWEGLLFIALGPSGLVSISSTRFADQRLFYDLVHGTIDPVAGWIAMVVVVALIGAVLWLGDTRRRHSGLVAPPVGLTVVKVLLIAAVGIAVVAISNVNRGSQIAVEGVPWAVPIVLVVFVAWSLLLQRTRFGRYAYAVGGNPEAARRAGISLAAIRTWCFVLCSLTAGIAGVLFASWQVEMSSNFGAGTGVSEGGGQLVLYAVAAAVIGGTSLFGGRGKALHGLLGGLVIGGIYVGLFMLSIGPAWVFIAPGLVLLGAVMIDTLSRRGAATGSVSRV